MLSGQLRRSALYRASRVIEVVAVPAAFLFILFIVVSTLGGIR